MANRRVVDPEPFPNFFRAWREYRGLKQTEVEEMFGWPISRVSNLETGRASITGHVLMALARAYRCSVADLVGRDPGPKTLAGELAAILQQKTGRGYGALVDALAALQTLDSEVKMLRTEVLARLKAQEKAIFEATTAVTEAVADALEIAKTFGIASETLRGDPDPEQNNNHSADELTNGD